MALAQKEVNVTPVARNKEKLKAVLAKLPNNNQCQNYLVADFQIL